MRYDCAGASAAQQITRLAAKVQLRTPELVAVAQSTPEQIAAILPAAEPDPPPPEPRPSPTVTEAKVADHTREITPAVATDPRESLTATTVKPASIPEPELGPEPESPEAAAERERAYREIFGIPEPKTRRRWRR